jgi:hypothetical protein
MDRGKYPFDGEFTQETRKKNIEWAEKYLADASAKAKPAPAPVRKTRTAGRILDFRHIK